MASSLETAQTIDKIPTTTLFTRFKYTAATAALQTVVGGLLTWKAFREKPSEASPDIVKTYPCRPKLPVSVFFPKFYDRSSTAKLPVLFTIHGGGFVIGSVPDNDHWNSAFANEHNVLVIGLNYAKAPGNPYPGPTRDVVALFLACASDPELPIDNDRIAIAGWSAGGNLALAAAQHPDVHKSIKAVVPLYPVLDFSIPAELKKGSRQYKPALGGFRGKETDYLIPLAGLFDWAYCPAGHDARDPGLSAGYASRELLPDKVFMVGCELDMLCHEDWRMICRLAGKGEPDKVVGRAELGVRGELDLDDERFYWEERREDGGLYTWLLVPDQVHGFDMDLGGIGADEETLEDGRLKAENMRTMIGKWLYANAYKM